MNENITIGGEFLFIVEMVRSGNILWAYDINHGGGLNEGSITEGSTRKDSQELFKLRTVATFDGMVAAVVGSWGDFVDQNLLIGG